MDGGSTDGSVEIIRKYAHHLTDWVSEKDRGQSHAINKGFQRATGDIRAFINSDDYYLPGVFKCVAQEYMCQPFDLIAGACRFVDAAGNLISVQKGNPVSLMDFLDIPRYERSCLTQPEVFWTRRVMDTCGAFREDLKIAFESGASMVTGGRYERLLLVSLYSMLAFRLHAFVSMIGRKPEI